MVRIASVPWYIGLETLKQYMGIRSDTKDDRIIALVGGASRFLEGQTGRKFYPTTAKRKFDWSDSLFIEFEYDDLIGGTLTEFLDENGDATITLADLLFEPADTDPKVRIKISPDKDHFTYVINKEQALHLTADWGYTAEKADTGVTTPTISSAIQASLSISDGSKVEVGWTLLLDSTTAKERVFIEDVLTVASGQTVNEAVNDYEENIDVTSPATFFKGEVIQVDNEDMKILRVDSASLRVIRGYNGTTPVSHSNSVAISVYRDYQMRRGLFGSTAASSIASGLAVDRYTPPEDIILAMGILVARMDKRADSGFADVIGSPDLGVSTFKKSMPVEVAAILSFYNRNFVDAIGI